MSKKGRQQPTRGGDRGPHYDTPPTLGLILKSYLTRHSATQGTSLSLQTQLRSVGQPTPMIDKRAVGVLSQSFGKPGTQLGGGQGTYTDSSAWSVLYVMLG